MPNWCYNIVTVEGEKAEVEKLVEFVKTPYSVFDFNTAIPYPKEYADMDRVANEMRKDPSIPWDKIPKDGYNSGGYHWCIDNWGTKWSVSDVSTGTANSGVEYSFDTAWSPSLLVTKKLASLFPALTFTHQYEEGGMDFSGEVKFVAGEIVLSHNGDYDAYPITDHEEYDDEDE